MINNTKTTTSNNQTVKNHDIKVTRVKTFDNGGIVFDMTVNGISIYGMNVVTYADKQTGEQKQFFTFPSRKGKDGKYYNYVYVKLSMADVSNIENQINSLLG